MNISNKINNNNREENWRKTSSTKNLQKNNRFSFSISFPCTTFNVFLCAQENSSGHGILVIFRVSTMHRMHFFLERVKQWFAAFCEFYTSRFVDFSELNVFGLLAIFRFSDPARCQIFKGFGDGRNVPVFKISSFRLFGDNHSVQATTLDIIQNIR